MARIKPQPIKETTRFQNLHQIPSSASPFFSGFDLEGDYLGAHQVNQLKRMRPVTRIEVEGRDGDKVALVNRSTDSYGRDPLEVLGWDLMMKIFGNLDPCSVAISLTVSRNWNGIASSDRLWTSMCEELWLGKAHIPRMSQVRGIPKLAAYTISVMDGKRNRIMRDDLCDHAWEFHFTEVAPEYWKNLDPYWTGTRPLMHRYFHQDGSQTADPGDRAWGGHECCFSVVTSILADGTIREHYVRINRWPRMSLSRKQDWSWEMSNQLVCYTSVPDSYKEGGTGPLFLVI
ncbi:uncharacterized protein [Euphorbia lathyris]|uniref:uncharacterized protein n=1 Tax=Euphorbia lathyris TaxID=212925 RepID=UPI0033143195